MTKTPCPKEVIKTGAMLVKSRADAAKLYAMLGMTIEQIRDNGVPDMLPHGVKEMQVGEAVSLLVEAQKSWPLIMQAHNSLRAILDECGVAEPTDEEILEAMREIKVPPVVASWR